MGDGDLLPTRSHSEEDKAFKAYNYRLAGTDWQAISEKLGYSSATVAKREVAKLVNRASDSMALEQREALLELELSRLDALQASVWGMAAVGDLKAIDTVLKIMSHRAKLLKLEDETSTSVNTIVITADSYAETLRGIS